GLAACPEIRVSGVCRTRRDKDGAFLKFGLDFCAGGADRKSAAGCKPAPQKWRAAGAVATVGTIRVSGVCRTRRDKDGAFLKFGLVFCAGRADRKSVAGYKPAPQKCRAAVAVTTVGPIRVSGVCRTRRDKDGAFLKFGLVFCAG